MNAKAQPRTVVVPAGSFVMGSSDGRPDESPPHEVAVRAFRLGRTPVTNGEYALCVRDGRVSAPPLWSQPGYDDPRQPAVSITWFDAVAYTEWLSERLSTPFRLPTEAEWERAARGGLVDARTSWGDALPVDEIPEGPLEGPWAAGRGTPNGFGLLDIGTIVHEWCLDWYSPAYYASSPRDDPRGPEEGERRASRGGSWRHRVRFSPPSARSSLLPHLRYADYGFRVLQEIDG
jgi:sulfatase modifying factor 1